MQNSLDLLLLNGNNDVRLLESDNQISHLNYNYQFHNHHQKIKIADIENKFVIENVQFENKSVLIKNKPHIIIRIHDKILISNIMNIYLNEENRDIFTCLKDPHTIQEIAEYCSFPMSSTYRKISFLLKHGYLQISGYRRELWKKSKSVKYEKTIQNITIEINENEIMIILCISEDIIKKSCISGLIKN